MWQLLAVDAHASPAGIPVWAYLLGALGIGGIATAVLTYLATRRISSGHIDTSDATDLWGESAAFRKELREEISSLRLRLADMEDKLVEANRTADQLRLEILELRRVCGITNEGMAMVQREISAVRAEYRRKEEE